MTTMGREDKSAEESTMAMLPVCCFLGGYFHLFVVSHMLAMVDGQRPERWWRRRWDERTTSPKKVHWLYYLSVVLFFYLFVVSHMLAMVDDNGQEDGGDDDGTRGQHRRRKYVGYTTCLLFYFFISLLSPTCWLWWTDNGQEDGGDDDGTRGEHRQRKYVGYTTCLLFLGQGQPCLCCVLHVLCPSLCSVFLPRAPSVFLAYAPACISKSCYVSLGPIPVFKPTGLGVCGGLLVSGWAGVHRYSTCIFNVSA